MRLLILLTCLTFLLSCNTKPEVSKNKQSACKTTATVKDFTGLDGCTFLILLENGDKLLPAKLNDESFTFRDGQKIRFDYKEMKDVMSICMAEKMTIEVTCIEEIE